jgi:thioesterase domain-containing protein
MTDQPNRLRETEVFLHEKIPLTQAMGVRVEEYDARQLILTAPLSLNHNHLGTAFGGALSAVATLAGYALLWLELDDPTIHVVIRKSSMDYRRPVRGDIRAVCRRPFASVLAAVKFDLANTGKARMRLQVEIEEEGRTAVGFEGTFVVMR